MLYYCKDIELFRKFQVNRKEFVGFHIFIMNFAKLGNISRKSLEMAVYKGFDQRDMLLKHIPYIPRRYPAQLS